jgi:membrane protease YdiL (CAAX protease family)
VEEPRRILPVQRVVALIEILICSGFPSQIFLVAVLSGLGMRARTPGGQLSPSFVFTLSMADAALVIALVILFLAAHGERGRQVLIGPRSISREAALGIMLLPVIFVILLLVLGLVFSVAPQLHNVPHTPLEDLLQNRRDAIIFGFVAMVAGGVREETQRGFILHRFEQFLGGGGVGVVVYSGLFGLGHLEQGNDAAVVTGILGGVWGVVYLVRRSIIAPMVSHAGFNLAQLVKYVSLR